jgi:hypothetical protein
MAFEADKDVTYTPTRGTSNTQDKTVKLVKR